LAKGRPSLDPHLQDRGWVSKQEPRFRAVRKRTVCSFRKEKKAESMSTKSH
jgi:hypothetical protein